MNFKKTLLILASSLIVGVIATTILKTGDPYSLMAQTNQSYGITFNSSKNKFHSYTGNTAYDGTATIQTNLGNDIEFSYYQVKGIASTWHVLGNGGYFYNVNPIHGMSSIAISFKTEGASYTLFYSTDNSFDHSATFTSSTSNLLNFDFDGYLPNYFKLVNNSGSNFNISSIDISLTCLQNYPTLSIASENETMGTVSGGGIKVVGENVTITASPNSGYKFVGWYDGETLISSNSTYSFTIGNEDLSYIARFTYESYNLLIQTESETKGTVSDLSGTYNYLDEITINATANSGYTFMGWYDGSTLISANNPYTFNMPYSDTTYTAKFSTNSYDLTLNNNNHDLGSITGNGTFLYGSSVTIIATPNTGVSFLGWYDNDDNLISSLSTYTFNMPYKDLEYTAKFEWTPYAVTIDINDDTMGNVTGSGSYIYQQEVNLTATPSEHHSFFGWYLDGELVSQESTLTFNMPNKSLNYEARFVINHYIYVYSDDETMGTVSSPVECGEGLNATVTANALSGYAIDYWYDDDLNEVSYDASYTFTMPNHDVTLYAAFTTGYTLTLTSSNDSKGTVSGAGQYKAGRSATATMTYISGIFKGWYDSNNNLVSTNNPYTFTMPANDCALVATFMTAEEEEAWNIAHGVVPNLSADGKTLTYGLYPQTNVNDSTLLAALNALTTPESNGWYLYNNEYYAKVNAKPYESSYKFDNGTTIVSETTYWFKCEPITWNVLSNNSGEYYILSSVLLDAHYYYNSSPSRTIDGKTVYINNYEYSDIRTWLNNDFYNSAFALGNSFIQTTTVDNSAATTDSTSNSYACANTEDKVFLLSYKDYINSSYGFSTSTGSTYTRYCRTTEWARARGACYNTSSSKGYYWTRSPKSGNSNYAWCVDHRGNLYSYVCTHYYGVRPSLSIKIA